MENMRKIVVHVTAGTGMDNWEFYEVDPKVERDVIDNFAEEAAIEWADSYGIGDPGNYPDPQDYESDDEHADAVDEWEAASHDWDQVEGSFEDYVPGKHDGYSMSGTPEFQRFSS